MLFAEIGLGIKLLVAWLVGGLAGIVFYQWLTARRRQEAEVGARSAIEVARREAESLLREARVKSSEELLHLREEAEKAQRGKRAELNQMEERISQRESLINQQIEGVVRQEQFLRQQQVELDRRAGVLEETRRTLDCLLVDRRNLLERASGMSVAEARHAFMKQVEEEAMDDANKLTRHVIDGAKARAEDQARRIIGLAIQRYASEHTFETTTATVALQGDENKGRIIGREGRNIRAFEAATGVTVLIDDTPNAVVLSAFDPVRREIARESMHRLILDGRIHPTRIEEVVNKVTQEMDETIVRSGEEAIFKLGLSPVHPEVVKLLGRLRFRHSFSQNILDHSIEVAELTGLMAAELGVDVAMAKRSGLLHDIGKALTHEVEGAHALVGADFLQRHGETEEVVNGVASHHDEVAHTNVFGVLVSAADAISASRPGARSENMTTYLKRLENLERIGMSFGGVEKCFAVQAGREVRVVLQPDQVSDQQAFSLARSIARKIEDELQYPGQIRVTVVRESRFVEFAK